MLERIKELGKVVSSVVYVVCTSCIVQKVLGLNQGRGGISLFLDVELVIECLLSGFLATVVICGCIASVLMILSFVAVVLMLLFSKEKEDE